MYSVIHRRVFTPLQDVPARIIEAINYFSNSTMTFLIYRNTYAFVELEKKIESLFYWGQKFSQRCENSFVNYGIHYGKSRYSLWKI